MACCSTKGCGEFFTEKTARRAARRYRRKGLDRVGRWIADFLLERGLDGGTVLEPGGGVGALQVELLKLGAARTVNVELSPAYEREAHALLAEAGLAGRSERLVLDFATADDRLEPADAVVLHRVVCCYPDYEALLTAAAAHARRLLVFSYPVQNLLSRLVAAAQNLFFRARRREFRVFVHPPERMVAVLEAQGLRPVFGRRALVWHVVGAERA